MASINYASKEISCKIVFYGPGLSGKTTSLQYVHNKIPRQSKGELISLATDQDRTLYFDFLPVDIGRIHGFSTKFQLYTVPGQVYYNATRKLVLRGVDGLVFVADSQRSKMDENIESLENLVENLSEYGYNIERMPLVFQYNKRDLNYISSVEELERALNPRGLPHFEAVATNGKGVFDTLKCISKLVLDQAKRKQLFPDRDATEKKIDKAPVEVDLSEAAASGPVAAAVGAKEAPVGDATSVQALAAIAVQEETEPPAEKTAGVTPGARKLTQSKGEADVGEVKKEDAPEEDGCTSCDGSTIISWSAGRSSRKAKSKGFFLLRWLGKLFK
jgi:signal recognition particle receptor subunit beta